MTISVKMCEWYLNLSGNKVMNNNKISMLNTKFAYKPDQIINAY